MYIVYERRVDDKFKLSSEFFSLKFLRSLLGISGRKKVQGERERERMCNAHTRVSCLNGSP